LKVLAINGRPRKTWNTAMLLQKALEGAASHGGETELGHLYDLDFKGCTSCFACKLQGSILLRLSIHYPLDMEG
jgi:multimeric flavodoxin WrbA